MKKNGFLLLAFLLMTLTACAPNLVLQTAEIDFTAKTVNITEKNVGRKTAGTHLTYIEINGIGVAAAAKPQSQRSLNVPAIVAGGTWSSGVIPFSTFSSPRGLDLLSLTSANLVVRVDAKNFVKESNESDNLYDRDH
jgi:hypothetical protein